MNESRHRGEPGVRHARRGISAPEVIVVVVIIVIIVLFLLVGLARQRESARSAACERNLSQIGIALILYDQGSTHLPIVASPLGGDPSRSPGPLLTMLDDLRLTDFSTLADPKQQPPRGAKIQVAERRIPGFVCPSESNILNVSFPAAVSYRATTGDEPEGQNGAFAPGRVISMAQISARDGTGFTAAFSERLLGNDKSDSRFIGNYAQGRGAVTRESCPPTTPGDWRGDAGQSWMTASWQSTLYNHCLTPNALPSCVAGDQRAARMGASSGHTYGVNVLFLDLSVRSFSPRVDPKIWREWARIGEASDADNQ